MHVLLTGATGFIGSHLRPTLEAAGHSVRCASRRPLEAARRDPGEWVQLDLADPSSYAPALEGCDAAIYLVHSIGADDYGRQEVEQARAFRRAALEAGVRRLVYLGGVCPGAGRSRHLEARRATGEALRGDPSDGLSVFELRAAMVIGLGSAGWELVRQLALLPVLPAPPWLDNRSRPIGLDDVLRAIVGSLTLPSEQAGCYELPGPERVRHIELMRRVATALNRTARFLPIPWIPRRLSSRVMAQLCGQDPALLAELLDGIRVDLDGGGRSLWPLLDHQPTSLDAAIAAALPSEDQLPLASRLLALAS